MMRASPRISAGISSFSPCQVLFHIAAASTTNLFNAYDRIRRCLPSTSPGISPFPVPGASSLITAVPKLHSLAPEKSYPSCVPSDVDFPSTDDTGGTDDHDENDVDAVAVDVTNYDEDGVYIEIKKTGKNSRRILSRITLDASLCTIWNILTDYERLPEFIPSLVVSQLLEKRPHFARLLQIGQQKLALGLKFNAKGVVDCHEKEIENHPFGVKRDIEFKMVDGDFQIFEGKWSIEQSTGPRSGDSGSSDGFSATLLYLVDVKPKPWLPVGLVEGRLCREIKMNLACIREEAHKAHSKSRHEFPDTT